MGRRRRRRYRYKSYSNFKIIHGILILIYIILAFIIKKTFKLSKWIYYRLKTESKSYTEEELRSFLKSITSRQFEKFCCELYKALGYSAKITPATHDGGVDVILNKFGTITYVECKHYSEKNMVGREICQKLLGSCVMNKADRAIVFTTGGIHRNAIKCEKMVDHLNIIGFNDIYYLFNSLSFDKRNNVVVRTISYL